MNAILHCCIALQILFRLLTPKLKRKNKIESYESNNFLKKNHFKKRTIWIDFAIDTQLCNRYTY